MRVLQARVTGYSSKRSAPDALIDSIRATAKGLRYEDS